LIRVSELDVGFFVGGRFTKAFQTLQLIQPN